MFRLLLVALLGCLVCNAQTATSGTLPTTSTRIIGGTETRISNYPYLVSLEYYASLFSGWDHDCGASILAPSVILTAAHCSYSRSASSLRARAGSTTRGSGGQVRQVGRIVIHPNYNSNTDDYDVAVLMLTTPLTFNANVKAIALPAAGASPATGQSVSIAGWGVTNTATASVPTTLMHTSVSIVSRQTCSTTYRGIASITSRMICALTANKDSCQGDSGGPMVNANGVQIGIVSFGVGCAEPGYPGVYTDLSNSNINAFVKSYIQSQTTTSTTTTTTPRPSQASRPTNSGSSSSSRPTRPGSSSSNRPSTSGSSSSRPSSSGSSSSRPSSSGSSSSSRPSRPSSTTTVIQQSRPSSSGTNTGFSFVSWNPCKFFTKYSSKFIVSCKAKSSSASSSVSTSSSIVSTTVVNNNAAGK